MLFKTFKMPNRQQVAFAVSFFGVFGALIALHHYIDKALRVLGYDISRLILIGLPTTQDDSINSTASVKFALPWSSNHNMTQATFDFKDFQDKGYTQIAALVAAVLSSIFIYLKFATSSECPEMPLSLACLTITAQSGSPYLTLQYGKNFP